MSETELQPVAPAPSPTTVRDRMIMLVLVLLTLACYWPVGTAEFINFDDNRYVTDNPVVQQGLTLEGLKYAMTSADGGYWHPLTWVSHMIDVELYGPKDDGKHLIGTLLRTTDTLPGGHHFTNLIFHVANTLLLWVVIKRLTGAVYPAAWVAAMFAVHPMHVESVAWISERKDVLSGLFFLLAIMAYQKYVEKPDAKQYLLVAAAFIGALMSKPSTVTLPCVLLLLDFWPLNRIQIGPDFWRSIRRPILEKVPLLLLSAGISALSIYGAKSINSFHSLATLPLGLRLETSVIAYARYLGKLFWPKNLMIFYTYPDSWPVSAVAGAVALFLALTALAAWQAKRRPFLLIGWLWFAGMLVPMIGLVATGDASLADRYTYLPYIGLFVAAAWLATSLAPHRPKELIGIGAVIIVVCIGLSYLQVKTWKDSLTVMAHVIKIQPDNWVGQTNYAVALADARMKNAGEHFKEAIRLRPKSVRQNVNYARWLIDEKKIDEAKKYIQIAGNIDPGNLEYIVLVGRIRGLAGAHDSAIKLFNYVLQRQPRSFEAEMYLANSLMPLGRIDEAEQHLRRAVQINSSLDMAYYHLGKIAAGRRNATEAIVNFQQAIALSPTNGLAHLDYGITLAALRRYDEAMQELQAAADLLKDDQLAEKSIAEQRMGQVLEKLSRQFDAAAHFVKSIDFAKQAAAAAPKEPSAAYQLAMTLKQFGNPDEAHAAAVKAMDVAAAINNQYFMHELKREFPDVPTPATRPTTSPSTLPATLPAS